MTFQSILKQRKFSLVASLPSNSMELAEAAVAGGADAIKVHINVWHRASGHSFGSFKENQPFLSRLIDKFPNVPIGLVCGGDENFITESELIVLESMGLSFYSAYIEHMPPFMLKTHSVSRMMAIHDGYTLDTIKELEFFGMEVLECSIQSGDRYGKRFTVEDLVKYRQITETANVPTLIPTQKLILPEHISSLYSIGVKALMIGAIVTAQSRTAHIWKKYAMRIAMQ